MQLHKALDCQKPHGQLLPGHFQVKNRHGFFVLFGHVDANVQCKSRLTHGRTGCHQQQIRLVQAVDLGIQIPHSGAQSGNQGIRLGQFRQVVKHLVQGGADVLQAVSPLALAQGIDLPLSRLQHLSGGTHFFLDHFGDVCGSLVQPPEHGLVPDDVGIADHIGRSRRNLHQLADVIPGIIVIISQLLHFVQNRHRVNGLGEIEHGVDGFINLPVLRQVEILRLQDSHHIRNAPAVNQNCTQHRLLRLQ